jgi:hypothetical protein
MAFGKARLALLAVAVERETRASVVIAIGSRGDDPKGDWQAAIIDDGVFRQYFSASPGPALENAETIFDLPVSTAIDAWLTKPSHDIGVSDGSGDRIEKRVEGTKLWIDGITRIHFFRRDDIFLGGTPVPVPLAWLDTAAEVVDEIDPTTIPNPEWAVSRLRLERDGGWPTDAAQAITPIDLTAFRFVGHVPVAVNAHYIDDSSSNDAWAKRYDTRVLLFAHAIRERQAKALWFSGQAGAGLSACFNGLTMGLSSADGLFVESDDDQQDPPTTAQLRGLHHLAAQGNPVINLRVQENVSRVRLLALVPGLTGAQPPKGLKDNRRRTGFRSILVGGREQLILRAEMRMAVKERDHWQPLWDSLVKPVTGQGWGRKDMATSANGSGESFSLIQEQIAGDAVIRTITPAQIDWLVTAQFFQRQGASVSPMEDRLSVMLEEHRGLDKLHRLRPMTGMSVIAGVTAASDTPPAWQAVTKLSTRSTRRRILRDPYSPHHDADWAKYAHEPSAAVEPRYFAPVQTANAWDKAKNIVPSSSPAKIDLSALTLADGTSLKPALPGRISAARDETDDRTLTFQPSLDETLRGTLCKVTVDKPWPVDKPIVRIVGLEFDLVYTTLEQRLWHRPNRDLSTAPFDDLTVEMTLSASAVRPVAQTDLPPALTALQAEINDPGGNDLIFAVGLPADPPAQQARKPSFRLQAVENVGALLDQNVVWHLDALQQADAPPSNAKLIIIDPTPFRVAAVETLRPDTDDSAARIATCAVAEDGVLTWRVTDRPSTVNLLYPPQTIGEAMEKYARGQGPRDIDPGEPVPIRFGSLTRIALDPTERDNNTHEPGWNLRRMLNRVADAAPGAIVRDVRFEIAYGLLVDHRPVRRTRIAEMAGIIGAPPRIAEIRGDTPHLQRMRKLLLLESSRIAVDKLWQDHPSEDFETSEGLRFRLRGKRGANGPATKFRFPARSGYPAETSSDPADQAIRASFADPADVGATDDAFAGGIPWAFESANVLRECYADPSSTTGRVGGLHFSALGGWGRQRAAFAGGKSIVETESTMGRLSFYKLERLGRIGGLHNRAKHVIIYRRTVAPPAQFFSEDEFIGKKQDEHLGRPILRKVEEYVDILQPERRYPEDGSAVAEAGCLSGARFVSRRIRVDSDWGGDVRNEGWMVPLWAKDIEKIPPSGDPDSAANLYPKPLVQLLMPGEDGGEVAVDIDTPERLVFYTSTLASETGDRIDSWHAVEAIDFCDAPPPIAKESAAPTSADLHDGMLAPAPRRAAGHDRLTLGLVDGRQPVRLGAGRVPESAAAVLKNVSISRARPLQLNGATATSADLTASAARQAGSAASQLSADIRGKVDRLFGSVPARFENLARDLLRDPQKLLNGRNHAKALVRDCEKSLVAELAQLDRAFKDAADKIDNHIGEAGNLGQLRQQLRGEIRQAGKAEADRLFGRIDSAIKQARDQLSGSAHEISGRWLDDLDALEKQLGRIVQNSPVAALRVDAKRLLATISERVATLVTNGTGEAKQDITDAFHLLRVNIDAVARIIPSAKRAICAEIASLRKTLDLTGEITRLKTQVDAWDLLEPAAIQQAKAEITHFLAVVRVRSLSAVNLLDRARLARGVPGAVADALRRASVEIDKIAVAVEVLQKKVDDAVWPPVDLEIFKGEIVAEIDRIAACIVGVTAEIDDALKTLGQETSTYLDPVETKLKEILSLTGLNAWETEAKGAVDSASQRVADAIGDIVAKADGLLTSADDLATEAIVAATRAGTEAIRAGRAVIEALATQVDKGLERADKAIRAPLPTRATVHDTIDQLTATDSDFDKYLRTIENSIAPIQRRVQETITGIVGTEQEAMLAVQRRIASFADALIVTIDEVFDRVADTQEQLGEVRRRIEAAVADQARQISGRVDDFIEGVQDELSRHLGVRPGDVIAGAAAAADQARYLYQEGDNVLRLIRAVGDPPKGDSLGFNRPEVAYVFDLIKPVVDVTPVLALANRVADTAAAAGQAAAAAGELLESFGLRLPIEGIGKDLIPDQLKDLSISKLFPDLAGLDLEGLLKDAGFPDLSGKDSQGVKVTRGFDKSAREAWLRAEIDVEMSKPATILEFGPVALKLNQGRFRAETEMRLDASGTMKKNAQGLIAGDWRLVTAGMDIITFEKTPLLFDKAGKIDFKIATERVRLAPTLEFLTNLMAKLGKSMPAGVEPVIRGGMPVGLVARLMMDLPPIATGAFAVTDLSLGASFGIIAIPEFEIAITLDIASRDAPFTLAVWLLNGGGYITQRLSYLPLARPRPLLTYTLDVSICAGVGLGFNFGVVSGGVWLQIGCSVALTWTTGRGGNVTTVTVYLLARGNVDVAGLVSASIMLRLEISYDGSVMLARGTLRLSFRISCFYTLRVAQGVEYKLIGERRSEAAQSDYAESFG